MYLLGVLFYDILCLLENDWKQQLKKNVFISSSEMSLTTPKLTSYKVKCVLVSFIMMIIFYVFSDYLFLFTAPTKNLHLKIIF